MITSKIKNIIITSLTLLSFISIFKNSKSLSLVIINTLVFCANKLIPSIFPFMVFSGIFMKIGTSVSGKDGIQANTQKGLLLKVTMFSWISGFLVGPKHISGCTNNKDITSIAVLCSNAGIGFVIYYVGIVLWGSLIYGTFLYIIQIVTSLFIYWVSNNIKLSEEIRNKKTTIYEAVTDSIQQATSCMLHVCGFTVFFSACKHLLCSLLDIKNSSFLYTIISSILEISDGTLSSVSQENSLVCAFFTGFAVGFGGVSMLIQTFYICENNIIYKWSFVIKKLIQGLICGLFSFLFIFCTDLTPARNASLGFSNNINSVQIFISAVFLFFSMNYLKKFIKKIWNHIDFYC